MMYLVNYEAMDADVSIIVERMVYITVTPTGDLLTQLTQALRIMERNAVISQYMLDDEDEIFMSGEYLG